MTAPIATAATHIAPYFDGGFWTGQLPPITYPFNPFTAVISMVDGHVIAMDTMEYYLNGNDIINAVTEAAAE